MKNQPQSKKMNIIKNIHQRLNEVRAKVKYIQKENRKVNGQYTFLSHDAVTEAVQTPMIEAGISMIPTLLEHRRDGNTTFVKMSLKYVNVDDPTDFAEVIMAGEGCDPQDKGVGKAVSYAIKYGHVKAFNIVTGDASDDVERHNIDAQPAGKFTPKTQFPLSDKISKFQMDELVGIIGEDALMRSKVCSWSSVNNLHDIPRINFEKTKERLCSLKTKAA